MYGVRSGSCAKPVEFPAGSCATCRKLDGPRSQRRGASFSYDVVNQTNQRFKVTLELNDECRNVALAGDDPDAFEAELELSFERLGCDRLDLLAIHGINLPEHLEQTLQPGGCMEVVRRWQAEGRIGHVGFSTHGPTALIAEACDSGAFDYAVSYTHLTLPTKA